MEIVFSRSALYFYPLLSKILIFSRPGRSQGPALRRRHAQTVRDRCSSYKIDYVVVIKKILNPEGHQNLISGSKVTAILLKGWIWPIGGASAGEGLRLQPAQQACLVFFKKLSFNLKIVCCEIFNV